MTLTILPGTSHREDDMALDPEVLAGLWHMEENHFWHRARNRWIVRALEEGGVRPGARVLEVGCGSGAVAVELHRRGYQVTGIDTADVLVRKAHERCPDARFVIGDVAALPERDGPFDVVAFFDVLEHLDEPRALLASALRLARPGALVIATVPALRSLHTVIDDLSGHKRRYEPGELSELFESASLRNVEEHGILRAIWPLIKLARRKGTVDPRTVDRRATLLADNRIPPAPVNRTLDLLCHAELALPWDRSKNRRAPSILGMGVAP